MYNAIFDNSDKFKWLDKLSREATLSKLFWLPSEKGSTIEGKNFSKCYLLKFLPSLLSINILK